MTQKRNRASNQSAPSAEERLRKAACTVRIRLRFSGLLETQAGGGTRQRPQGKAKRLGATECLPDGMRREFVVCPVGALFWNMDKSPNERSRVDAGRPLLFAFARHRPGTTHRER